MQPRHDALQRAACHTQKDCQSNWRAGDQSRLGAPARHKPCHTQDCQRMSCETRKQTRMKELLRLVQVREASLSFEEVGHGIIKGPRLSRDKYERCQIQWHIIRKTVFCQHYGTVLIKKNST